MIFKNKKTQTVISFILIIFIIAPAVLLSRPKETNATAPVVAPVSDALKFIGNTLTGAGTVSQGTTAAKAVQTWYQVILEQVLKAIAKKALQVITKSTVNWINGGFHGSPLFLENADSFFTDVVKSEVKTAVDRFGYDKVKFPFGRDFALNTINSYKKSPNDSYAYTLSNVIKDPITLSNYQNNFNTGGWDAFFLNTQYQQNNYLGFQMLANQDLAGKISSSPEANNKITKIKETLSQGSGFLSPQTCPSNPSYNNGLNEFQRPSFDSAGFDKTYKKNNPYPKFTDYDTTSSDNGYAAAVEKWESDYNKLKAIQEGNWSDENTCPGGLVATTPGAVVSSQITTALGSNFRQTELGAALGNSLSQIFDALLNKLLDEGLNALASTVNPQPVEDDWSYNGLKLGGPADGDDPFSGPDQEVILKNFRILIDGKTIRTFNKGEQLLGANGILETYTSDDLVICKDGDKIIDTFTGETLRSCIRGDEIMCKFGEQIDYSSSTINKACTGTNDQKQYHANGEKVFADGGEMVTFIGNTVAETGGEYFPGGLQNTIEELGLMDNPCDPSSASYADCSTNPGKYDPITNKFIYNPGITQIINPVLQATQALDQCIPGPDKGWEFRIREEEARLDEELTNSSSEGDNLKKAATAAVRNELKFAVTAFKDWVNTKMMNSLNGSIFYQDAVSKIDDIYQDSKELIDSKRTKAQALARLTAIKTTLEALAESLPESLLGQPAPDSPAEKQMILLWKQYEAARPSISSSTTIENSRNQLNVLKEQLIKLTSMDIDKNGAPVGLIASCEAGREKNGWEAPDPSGRGAAGNSTTQRTELEQFCSLPIISGYSHGEPIRNDKAMRDMNCPDLPSGGDSPACDNEEIGSENVPDNWYMFRNPLAAAANTSDWGGSDGAMPPYKPAKEDTNKYDLGSSPEYRDLPLVNAPEVYGDETCTGLCSWGSFADILAILTGSPPPVYKPNADDQKISINIDCRTVFKARPTDYTNAGNTSGY